MIVLAEMRRQHGNDAQRYLPGREHLGDDREVARDPSRVDASVGRTLGVSQFNDAEHEQGGVAPPFGQFPPTGFGQMLQDPNERAALIADHGLELRDELRVGQMRAVIGRDERLGCAGGLRRGELHSPIYDRASF